MIPMQLKCNLEQDFLLLTICHIISDFFIKHYMIICIFVYFDVMVYNDIILQHLLVPDCEGVIKIFSVTD